MKTAVNNKLIPLCSLMTILALLPITTAVPAQNKPSDHLNSALEKLNRSAVSFDAFFAYDESGHAIKGNGTGDLVLLMLDQSGKSPRKKSLMLDLSFVDSNGKLNDLTVNDILKLNKPVVIRNPKVSSFIINSKEFENIKWLIFGIADHTSSILGDFNSLKIINSGIVITEPLEPGRALNFNGIKRKQAFLSNLIQQNNDYGIEENNVFISYSSEPSFFVEHMYGYLKDGRPGFGKLREPLHLNMHRKELVNRLTSSDLIKLGMARLQYSKDMDQWELILAPYDEQKKTGL